MAERRKFLDPDHPMFAKPWVRWATVLVPGLWAGFEASRGDWMWAAGFGVLAAYAFNILILRGPTGGK